MFKKNFINLCNKKGVSPSAVCRHVGLSNAAYSCWTDESVPRKATLMRIADYFDVSVDYLLGNQDKSTGSLRVNIPDHVPLQLFAEETPKPEAYPQIISIMDEMSTEELADLKQYAEFIRSRKKD